MNSAVQRARPDQQKRGFTLTEILMTMVVGSVVLAGLAAVLVMAVRLSYKNDLLQDATNNTRLVQEHLNRELSAAISQNSPVVIQPIFENAAGTVPERYARVRFRINIGSHASVAATALSSASNITLNCTADIVPEVGDYLLMDTPNLGNGVQIVAVSDSRSAGSSGTVDLTLATTLAASTTGTVVDAAAAAIASIQRERAYETVTPSSGAALTELHFFSNWASADYIVLSDNLDASSRYLFTREPSDPTAVEASVSWQFSYVAATNGASIAGSNPEFYTTNFASGLIMPKSGNPLGAASISGITTSISTSTTSTTSTTSISTTSTSTTSTTSTATTTTKSTSTSSIATTKTTSTKATSTSKTTTSKTTTKSTTSKSTTKTTSVSTSSIATTKTTSASTSSVATTSASTTSSATTTKTTSATTSSVATTTKTTTSATTSASTTSTIPFDG